MQSCISIIILLFNFDELNILSLLWKIFWFCICTNIYCVDAGISKLVSISDGLGPYIFRRKIDETERMKEEMDGTVFISRWSRHFRLCSFYD